MVITVSLAHESTYDVIGTFANIVVASSACAMQSFKKTES